MTQAILVLGSTGLLGVELVDHLRNQHLGVVGHGFSGRADVVADLRSAADVETLIREVDPGVIVNLVALTDVDRCEREPDAAQAMNAGVVSSIAQGILRAKSNSHLIQVSTDQVYSGSGLQGESTPSAINVYARTKLEGEREAGRVPSTVLRTNFVGRSRVAGRQGLSDWIVGSIRQGRRISVFEDVYFSPLSTDSLCSCVARVASRRVTGVFNLGSRGGVSKADFAFALCRHLDLDMTLLSRGSVAGAHFNAARPNDMRMNVAKFEQCFELTLPDTMEEIEKVGRQYEVQA